MSPRRLAASAGLRGTVIGGWVAIAVVSFVLARNGNTRTPIDGSRAASVSTTEQGQDQVTGENGASAKAWPVNAAVLPELPPTARSEPEPAQVGQPSIRDPMQTDANEAAQSVEAPDQCLVSEICIDQDLWSLYQKA